MSKIELLTSHNFIIYVIRYVIRYVMQPIPCQPW